MAYLHLKTMDNGARSRLTTPAKASNEEFSK
jgi:hypothetical protein